MIIDQNNYLL